MFRLISVAAVFFALGVLASDSLTYTYTILFGSEKKVDCLPDGGICVGDRLSENRINGLYTLDETGGLGSIFCEDVKPSDMRDDLLLTQEIIIGKRCEGQLAGFMYRNKTVRTLVKIKNGIVTEITRGPLHIIDP